MAETFVSNTDSLVTRDYLDARFAEQNAGIDIRFSEVQGSLRLIHWMLGLVILSTTVPIISFLFLGLIGSDTSIFLR